MNKYSKNNIAVLCVVFMLLFATSGCNSASQATLPFISQSSSLTNTLDAPYSQPIKKRVKKSILGKILFVSHYGGYEKNSPDFRSQICCMDSDGNNQEILFESKTDIRAASCSPDGTWIAYLSDEQYTGQTLFVMDAVDTVQIPLTAYSPSVYWYLVWSPDGSKIAYTSQYPVIPKQSTSYIYTVSSDGSNVARLTGNDYEWAPAWSPDGSRIAFTKGPPPADPASPTPTHIWIMNSDGSNRTNLTSEGVYCESPYWSPDGTHIAFTKGYGGIYSMKPDGTNQVQLTFGSFRDLFSSNSPWSPDGSKIAFVREKTLCVINADGSNLKIISENTPSLTQTYAWSADSRKLAFIAGSSDNLNIYMASADGSNQICLLDNKARNYYVSWPD